MISLFDRWPYDPLAKRYDLLMGPVVTTNRKKIEYRWNMSISPTSISTLLYVAVEVPVGVNNSNSSPTIYTSRARCLPPCSPGGGATFLSDPTT
jgi:hypothetical protein